MYDNRQLVFLDTCVFVQEQFNMQSQRLRTLDLLVASGAVRLVTTDIVVREVRANISSAIKEASTNHRRFRSAAAVLRAAEISRHLVEPLVVDEVEAEVRSAFDAFISRTSALVLATGQLTAGPVLEDYFAIKAPFEVGNRRKEFPDAFSLAAVREWLEVADESLIFVTADKGLGQAARAVRGIEHLETLAALLNHLYSKDEPRSRFLKHAVIKRGPELTEWAADVFADLSFVVKNQVEGEVSSVKVKWVAITDDANDVDIVQMDAAAATLLAPVEIAFEALLRYRVDDCDPDGISYDRDVEEHVTATRAAQLEISVAFAGFDPQKFEISKIDFPDLPAVLLETRRDWR